MVKELEFELIKNENSRLNEVDFDNLAFGRVFSDHMFYLEYKDGKWQNGKLMPYGDLSLSPATAVFHYGQAIFEGMKAYKDTATNDVLLFRPEDNGERLAYSARRMGIPPIPVDLFLEGLSELVKLDHEWIPTSEGSSLYVRPFIFAADPYVGVRASETYKFVIITSPVGAYYPHPVSVLVEEKFVRAFKGGTGDAKAAGNYAGTLHPALLGKEKGFDQVLWTDGTEHKYLEEIGTMNVFFLIDGKAYTPELSGTILEGITRDSVIQLLREQGIKVEEKKLSIDEIVAAHKAGTLEDAFGTGTAATITHISKIGYRDLVMELPPVADRKISLGIKKTLTELKTGLQEDTRDWIVRLKPSVY